MTGRSSRSVEPRAKMLFRQSAGCGNERHGDSGQGSDSHCRIRLWLCVDGDGRLYRHGHRLGCHGNGRHRGSRHWCHRHGGRRHGGRRSHRCTRHDGGHLLGDGGVWRDFQRFRCPIVRGSVGSDGGCRCHDPAPANVRERRDRRVRRSVVARGRHGHLRRRHLGSRLLCGHCVRYGWLRNVHALRRIRQRRYGCRLGEQRLTAVQANRQARHQGQLSVMLAHRCLISKVKVSQTGRCFWQRVGRHRWSRGQIAKQGAFQEEGLAEV